MPTTFTTNPVSLEDLLARCRDGRLQLPDFQRSWVWDENRIVALLASVSQGFPIGTLMTLATRANGASDFATRTVEGASSTASKSPEELLLDGQQRMTALYQTCLRQEIVKTITTRNKVAERWFYIDIEKALRTDVDREEAVLAVPADRQVKTDFSRTVVLDLSTKDHEYAQSMFPLNQAFDWEDWRDGFENYWRHRDDQKREMFLRFRNEILRPHFVGYQVPVISLGNETTHAAVCLVFEKVNTGGKALDAFELLTAMYAADGHRLRDDWWGALPAQKTPNTPQPSPLLPGIQRRLSDYDKQANARAGVLGKVASTDFLQAVSLMHTKSVREARLAAGAKESELPAIRATRQSLLDLPLDGYLRFRDAVEEGFKQAAKFVQELGIRRDMDVPYQTQLVPLAAILATLGRDAEHAGYRAKLARWYWCGIFGELYGSAVESRFARDIVEVPAWLRGGPEPSTVRDGVFRADRLFSMFTRQSAAYKGVHALLMRQGAKDFRTGQPYDMAVFFDEDVDIHHIFPQAWCRTKDKPKNVWDCVINKTPLGSRTNRIIGGVAPSEYMQKLQDGRRGVVGQVIEPSIDRTALHTYVASHCIDVDLLRADDFETFIEARRQALLQLIAAATGHVVIGLPTPADDGIDLDDAFERDSRNEDAA